MIFHCRNDLHLYISFGVSNVNEESCRVILQEKSGPVRGEPWKVSPFTGLTLSSDRSLVVFYEWPTKKLVLYSFDEGTYHKAKIERSGGSHREEDTRIGFFHGDEWIFVMSSCHEALLRITTYTVECSTLKVRESFTQVGETPRKAPDHAPYISFAGDEIAIFETVLSVDLPRKIQDQVVVRRVLTKKPPTLQNACLLVIRRRVAQGLEAGVSTLPKRLQKLVGSLCGWTKKAPDLGWE